MKIVIVVEQAIIRYQLKSILQKLNTSLFLFSPGNEAIDFLEINNDVAIVITDWMKSDEDGLEIIPHVKKMENQRFAYIILLTSVKDADPLAAGMNLGADDYIRKPIEEKEVFARVCAGIRFQQLQNELRAANNELTKELERVNTDLISAGKLHKTILPEADIITDSLEVSSFHTRSIL